MAGSERLQKLISAAGITSRRKAEQLIAAGRVTLNGQIVREPGTQADPALDDIRVDGRALAPAPPVYLAVHKPAGVVTSVSDPHAERVVLDLIGPEIEARVYPAGRLDIDSEGLVILTNDGELMHAMTRPASGVDKVYEVDIEGSPSERELTSLRQGPELEGRQLLPCGIDILSVSSTGLRLRVVLHEGKKNQIRRMFKNIGHPVRRLNRVGIGPIVLAGLSPGAYRPLAADEVEALRLAAGLRPQPGRAG